MSFWSSWHHSCREHDPSVRALHQDAAGVARQDCLALTSLYGSYHTWEQSQRLVYILTVCCSCNKTVNVLVKVAQVHIVLSIAQIVENDMVDIWVEQCFTPSSRQGCQKYRSYDCGLSYVDMSDTLAMSCYQTVHKGRLRLAPSPNLSPNPLNHPICNPKYFP